MIRKYITLLNRLSIQHPDDKDDLNTIQAVMEILVMTENQLDGYKRAPRSAERMIRESVGTLMSHPLESANHDIYRPINKYIVNAIKYIGAKSTANHIQNLFEREAMLGKVRISHMAREHLLVTH